MFWFGLLLILGGIINIISAKKQLYWGFNASLWLNLFGESATRIVFFISGIMLITFGIFIISSLWS